MIFDLMSRCRTMSSFIFVLPHLFNLMELNIREINRYLKTEMSNAIVTGSDKKNTNDFRYKVCKHAELMLYVYMNVYLYAIMKLKNVYQLIL